MKIRYQEFGFRNATLALIEQANEIIAEYLAEGYELTVRQLYYQFVARDMFPEDRRWLWTGTKWKRDPKGTKNADPNYKWLGTIINDGRLAGEIDWKAIVDRTRQVQMNSHWDSPGDILRGAANAYALDTRETQLMYVEVWIEKEALAGILERACKPLDVAYFSCRGYVSQSAMWRAGQRICKHQDEQECVLLHLGDHDPSGIDMTRDIQDRLILFGAAVEVKRIALNMDQIKQYRPPPNPAKVTDSRCAAYIAKYGSESWELDALDPRTINSLIVDEVGKLTNVARRNALIEKQESDREKLESIADNYDESDV